MSQATLFELEGVDYQIPPMSWWLAQDNGLTAVSTFSGCGGSSLGLHGAGWRIPYAVEFIPPAQETYMANFPDTFVDPRDIRKITGVDILNRIGLDVGELDLFEGSPPCSSFSDSNRSKNARIGNMKVKNYSEGVKQTTDDLFDEWVRLISEIRPKTFLAENVPGLLSPDARPFFTEMMWSLTRLGYHVDGNVYNAHAFGAATFRARLIIRGIRKDVGPLPPRPRERVERASLGDALATCPPSPMDEMLHADAREYEVGRIWGLLEPGTQQNDQQTKENGYFNVRRTTFTRAVPGPTAAGSQRAGADIMHPTECRKFTARELAWFFGYPADFILTGNPQQRYERVARSVPPPFYVAHGKVLADALLGNGNGK